MLRKNYIFDFERKSPNKLTVCWLSHRVNNNPQREIGNLSFLCLKYKKGFKGLGNKKNGLNLSFTISSPHWDRYLPHQSTLRNNSVRES